MSDLKPTLATRRWHSAAVILLCAPSLSYWFFQSLSSGAAIRLTSPTSGWPLVGAINAAFASLTLLSPLLFIAAVLLLKRSWPAVGNVTRVLLVFLVFLALAWPLHLMAKLIGLGLMN